MDLSQGDLYIGRQAGEELSEIAADDLTTHGVRHRRHERLRFMFAEIEPIEVGLEKTYIQLADLKLVWIPTG